MDDFQSTEETAFVVDEVTNIIKESVEGAIGGNAYQHNKVNQWTSNVVEQCLNQLTKLGKPFKYIVSCVIMQKTGAGLHVASSCFWDSSTDDFSSAPCYWDKMIFAAAKLGLVYFAFWVFLFTVTCVIMQKNGAGLHTASSCFWDNSTDGSCTVRWENKTMYCIVSVFGLAI